MPSFQEKFTSEANQRNLLRMKNLLNPQTNPRIAEVFESKNPEKVEFGVERVGFDAPANRFENYSLEETVVEMAHNMKMQRYPMMSNESATNFWKEKEKLVDDFDMLVKHFDTLYKDYKAYNTEYNQDEYRLFENVNNIVTTYKQGRAATELQFEDAGLSEEDKDVFIDEIDEKITDAKNAKAEFLTAQKEFDKACKTVEKKFQEGRKQVIEDYGFDILQFVHGQQIKGVSLEELLTDHELILGNDSKEKFRQGDKFVAQMRGFETEPSEMSADDVAEEFARNGKIIEESCDLLKPKLEALAEKSNALAKAKQTALVAINKENDWKKNDIIKEGGKERTDLMNTLLGTKKAFGDSKFFEDVKREITAFQAANDKFNKGELDPSTFKEKTEALMTALNTYKQNRDIGAKRKATKVGQQRIDAVNSLIENLNSTVDLLGTVKVRDERRNDVISLGARIEPKSKFEAIFLNSRVPSAQKIMNPMSLANAEITQKTNAPISNDGDTSIRIDNSSKQKEKSFSILL